MNQTNIFYHSEQYSSNIQVWKVEKLSKIHIWWLVYVQIGTRGTVTEAAGFNPEADVQKLREAMKGAGECHHISTWKETITGI